jgi:hypothetical protein
VLKRAGQQFSQHRLTDLAAALTFYAVLSIVPGLIVLISILGLLGADTTTQVGTPRCPETVRKWVRQHEVDGGSRPGVCTEEPAELKRLKRENAELKRANGIL